MSAPALEPADLETLERLCEKGEMLLSAERVFYPLQNLIDAKLAEVVGFWMGDDKNARNGLSVVKPTLLGRQTAAIRTRLKKPRLKCKNYASQY